MSLQTRIIALVSAVLLVSIVFGAALAGVEGKIAVRAEVRSALQSGAQAVGKAYEDLPRSDHQDRDLRQLVAAFEGDRHLIASLDEDGARQALSRPGSVAVRAPPWFEHAIASKVAPVVLPTPPGARAAVIRLEPAPQSDIGALWSELSGLVGVLTAATAICLLLLGLTVRAALAPLRALSDNLSEIGRGEYRSRAPERGPSEVLDLERSFNAMAERLETVSRVNGELERQLQTIQEEERAEIARDLHDEVGPQLFAVSLDAQLIAQHLAQGRPDAVPAQVEAIQSGVRHVQREIRAMVARLRPARATELGLRPAVEDLASFWTTRRPEIAFALDVELEEAAVGEPVKDTAYRIVQEAVSNAVRHARPERIEVALRGEAAVLRVQVRNDGVKDAGAPAGRGFGLDGMRERAAAVGGEITAGLSAADDGLWVVSASLPVCGLGGRLRAYGATA